MKTIYFIGALLLHTSLLRAGVETIPTDGRTVYRLAAARSTAEGKQSLIVGSTTDDRVCVWDERGQRRWEATLPGFVFDLCCADLDGDGTDEILTAGADGSITCFSVSGRQLWRHTLPAPVLQVTVARLDGKFPVVLAGGISRTIAVLSPTGACLRTQEVADGAVRVLRAGDFDGDGRDEVAVQPIRLRGLDVSLLAGPELKKLSATIPSDGLRAPNGTVADINGDGTSELLLAETVSSLTGAKLRSVATLPQEPAQLGYDHHYRMRNVAVGNLTARPGKEIVTVDGPDVQLCAADGRLLAAAHGPLGFTAAVYLPGTPQGTVVLGSGTGGDDNLYRITFDANWQQQLASLPRRGRLAAVSAENERFTAAAARWAGPPMRGTDGPYDVVATQHMMGPKTSPSTVTGWIEEVRFYQKAFPYPRLRFSTNFWPGEKLPIARPDGAPWPHDKRLGHHLTHAQIVGMGAALEKAGCHFWVQVGHGCSPHLSLGTIAALLEAAPVTCLGFVSAEDEQEKEMTYYFEHFIRPILELCLPRGKHFIERNKNVWWARWPADPVMRKLIFNGRYRGVLLPSAEDSNTRTADVQLAARVGLWLNGEVDDWASRSCADWFSFNRSWEWESVMTGHPQFRHYLSQALLGARVFMLLNGELAQHELRWSRVGTEGATPFLHLLGRGVITPPTREQMRSLSPVALALREPTPRFQRHGANGHGNHQWNIDGSDGQPWAFDRLDCYWGMAPLAPTDVSTYLWGRTRRAADHIPVTAPHGFVAMLPGDAPRRDGPWSTVWTTDGDTLSKDGKTYPLVEARRLMMEDLAAGAAKAPFSVTGQVFHQVIEQSADRIVVALVDPGWVDPADKVVRLSTRLPGTWQVRDRLTHAALGVLSAPLELTVPAGGCRLLDLERP